MQRCEICNGRTIQTPEGIRCMNSSCEGAKPLEAKEGVLCRCGQSMHYTTSNAYGDRNYACSSCGATITI